jgi:hypothetical protein
MGAVGMALGGAKRDGRLIMAALQLSGPLAGT